jgi:hypothetical protein
MNDNDRNNEIQKLIANWLNTLATGFIVAGTFVPAFQYIYGLLPKDTDWALPVFLGCGCALFGIFLHLLGQLILGWRLK